MARLSNFCDVVLFNPEIDCYNYIKNGGYFNFKEFDYVLEIHFNAGGGRGTEILVHTTESGTSVEENILNKICDFGFVKRGVKKKDAFLVQNTVKKKYGISHALLEVCFIDSATDIIRYESNKEEIADAIVKGIADGFGLIQQEEHNMVEEFTDIKNHWAKEYIEKVAESGIMKGDGNGKFRPNDLLTRAEMAVIITRLLEKK